MLGLAPYRSLGRQGRNLLRLAHLPAVLMVTMPRVSPLILCLLRSEEEFAGISLRRLLHQRFLWDEHSQSQRPLIGLMRTLEGSAPAWDTSRSLRTAEAIRTNDGILDTPTIEAACGNV